MNILLIDTCAEQGSVAIADPVADPARGFSAALPGRSASEKLIGSIRDLANQSGISLRDLNAIAVVNGPGSFTGIRVGLSAAKGLCEALGIPLMVISRLAVLASLARAQPEASVIAALDAGRGEFYFGEYSCGDKLREGLASREALAQVLNFSSSALIVHEHALVNSLAEFSPRSFPNLTPPLRSLWPSGASSGKSSTMSRLQTRTTCAVLTWKSSPRSGRARWRTSHELCLTRN